MLLAVKHFFIQERPEIHTHYVTEAIFKAIQTQNKESSRSSTLHLFGLDSSSPLFSCPDTPK